MSKSGRGNPPKEFQFKKGVSGNRKGRPPKSRKDQLVSNIVSKVLNALTTYREGGRTKRASRLELAVKRLVISALEGDVKSADLLFKLRAVAENNNGARIEKFIAEGWIPDFPGQTGEQKTRAHARDNEIDPTDFWEPSSEATDPSRPVSASPNPLPDP
jgi:Family of unknown function (DUF5681)